MEKKNGFVELQFNWILIAILGSVILSMFLLVSYRGKSLSDASSSILAANSLSYVLASRESIEKSSKILSLPESKILFGCNSYQIDGVSKSLSGIVLFSPSSISGKDFLVATLAWKYPYYAGNFLYATNPEIRYIFIGSSEFARNTFQNAPGGIKKDGYTNIDAITEEKDKEIRLVFFGMEPELSPVFSNSKAKITSIKIDGNEQHGIIEFFDFKYNAFEPVGSSIYDGEASLFGAILSDNPERYKCSMKNAFQKLNLVSSVYLEKAGSIAEEYSKNKNKLCFNLYTNSTHLSDSLILMRSAEFENTQEEALIDAIDTITMFNEESAKLSCAQLY